MADETTDGVTDDAVTPTEVTAPEVAAEAAPADDGSAASSDAEAESRPADEGVVPPAEPVASDRSEVDAHIDPPRETLTDEQGLELSGWGKHVLALIRRVDPYFHAGDPVTHLEFITSGNTLTDVRLVGDVNAVRRAPRPAEEQPSA